MSFVIIQYRVKSIFYLHTLQRQAVVSFSCCTWLVATYCAQSKRMTVGIEWIVLFFSGIVVKIKQ